MRTFWLHLRCTPLRRLLPVLLVLDVVLVLTRDDYWHGLWGETGAVAQGPALYVGVFAAGAAAWSAALHDRPEVAEPLRSMPRPTPRAELPRLVTLLFIVLVPYVAGQAVAFTITARTWPPGFGQYLGYALLGAVSLVLATAWGWLLGRLLPGRWGPLAGAFTWIIVNLAVKTDLIVVNGPAREQTDLPLIVLRLAAAVVLLGTCLWLPPGRESVRRVSLSTAAVSLALGGTVYLSGASVITTRHGSASMLCVKGPPAICLWPEEEKYRAMAERVLARAEGMPQELARPERVYSYGLVREEGAWLGDFDMDSGSEWAMADGVTRAMSEKTFAACADDDFAGWDRYQRAGDTSVLALERWLEKRLAGGGKPAYTESGVPGPETAAIEKGKAMADRPAAEQEQWARHTIRSVLEKYCA
ncbi:hypothetical protein IAG44_21390 [Streptomyces roseirectus]|uniref:Uncharacterized protein n=1 Tax=Streptomyces roseirectus TaxID=2768066 RepID=A0A7H0IG12_9ACTN|nr:hypothetical protein [Streptomyces roseirectus]QNP71728.1 hypothetical protein IAG44_21390 [Streptomyces roseirectus]